VMTGQRCPRRTALMGATHCLRLALIVPECQLKV
jgi:hypothetical protein